jgi:predicted DsbA family dithiol-disulfide isomerase
MLRAPKPLHVVVYQDVLCAWCYVAEIRLARIRHDLGSWVNWEIRPFPIRLTSKLPTEREREMRIREVQRARREPEGSLLTSTLWTQGDAPGSSVDVLTALEAASLQGSTERHAFAKALQRAALEQGVNVTRPDIVFEVASRVGLEMNHFAAAFNAPRTRKLVTDEHRFARARGVVKVPTLVIAGRWMISGLREETEYRRLIVDCISRGSAPATGSTEPVVH